MVATTVAAVTLAEYLFPAVRVPDGIVFGLSPQEPVCRGCDTGRHRGRDRGLRGHWHDERRVRGPGHRRRRGRRRRLSFAIADAIVQWIARRRESKADV